MVYAVADLCPWEPGEVDELAIHRWELRKPWWRGGRRRDWANVARVAVDAVNSGLDGADRDAWRRFGERTGLRRDDLFAFETLAWDPICVSPLQWTNGRHRSLLMQRAGASHIVVVDPEWMPDYGEPER